MSIRMLSRDFDLFDDSGPVRNKIIKPEKAVLQEELCPIDPTSVVLENETDYTAFATAYDKVFSSTYNTLQSLDREKLNPVWKILSWLHPGFDEITLMRNRTYIYADAKEYIAPGRTNCVRVHYMVALATPAYMTPPGYPTIYPLLRQTAKAFPTMPEADRYLADTREKFRRKYFTEPQPAIDLAFAKKPHRNGLPLDYDETGYTNEFPFQMKHGFTVK